MENSYISKEFADSLVVQTIDSAQVGVTITDPSRPDNPIIYLNSGFTKITGYTSSETLGRNCRFLQGGVGSAEAVEEMRRGIKEKKPVTVEILNRHKDGSVFWNEVYIEPLYREGKLYFLGVQKDISKQKEYEENLEKTQAQVYQLSTPIVPVTEEFSVLPVIGDLSYERFETIRSYISETYYSMHYSYLVLDLSGLGTYDEIVADGLLNLNRLLKMLGAKLIITGLSPELSIAFVKRNINLNDIQTASTVKDILKQYGIT
ncbi:PAS domain-containing protein [Sinobaca sp. H24]|uniref:PAS domain-containing protein n=1 Tax=Sinobaca sp. H24 TaxID=2923376 RepID=UPI00207A44AE|nr:PAS domain-containing protein [Sinobaca sp. H24]